MKRLLPLLVVLAGCGGSGSGGAKAAPYTREYAGTYQRVEWRTGDVITGLAEYKWSRHEGKDLVTIALSGLGTVSGTIKDGFPDGLAITYDAPYGTVTHRLDDGNAYSTGFYGGVFNLEFSLILYDTADHATFSRNDHVILALPPK